MMNFLCYAVEAKGCDPLLRDLAEDLSQSMAKSPFPLLLGLSDGHSGRASFWVHWINQSMGRSHKGELSVFVLSDGTIEAVFHASDFPGTSLWKRTGGVEDISTGLIRHMNQFLAQVALLDPSNLPFNVLADLWKICCVDVEGFVGFIEGEDWAIVMFEGGVCLRLTSQAGRILAKKYPSGIELPGTFYPHEIEGVIERFRFEDKG